MSTTNPINSTTSGKNSDTKKKVATIAAVGAAATGLGVAGAAVLSDDENEEEVILEDVFLENEEEGNEVDTDTSNSTSESNTEASSQTSHHTSTVNASGSQTQNVAEPEPITDDGGVVEGLQNAENINEADTQAADSEPHNIGSDADQSVTIESSEELVNPDEIAQAIISEDHIDPEDMDMADVVNFDEIGTVYTVDGESYTAAAFHDAAGNDLVMIDVDGDNVFDVITDYDGNLISEVPGNISVGDAMEDIMEDETYLAYDSETDNVDEFDTDSLTEDILA